MLRHLRSIQKNTARLINLCHVFFMNEIAQTHTVEGARSISALTQMISHPTTFPIPHPPKIFQIPVKLNEIRVIMT
jgi:hypothetical protein